jgi:hypothetical protein
MPAVLEATSVKVPATPGVRERDEGEDVTPVGKPLAVTETEPAKPPCALTKTCTFCEVPPCASVTLAGETETVKLGIGGGGG